MPQSSPTTRRTASKLALATAASRPNRISAGNSHGASTMPPQPRPHRCVRRSPCRPAPARVRHACRVDHDAAGCERQAVAARDAGGNMRFHIHDQRAAGIVQGGLVGERHHGSVGPGDGTGYCVRQYLHQRAYPCRIGLRGQPAGFIAHAGCNDHCARRKRRVQAAATPKLMMAAHVPALRSMAAPSAAPRWPTTTSQCGPAAMRASKSMPQTTSTQGLLMARASGVPLTVPTPRGDRRRAAGCGSAPAPTAGNNAHSRDSAGRTRAGIPRR